MTSTDVQDKMLDEPRAGGLTVRYQPDGDSVYENPPRFAWLPALDETAAYVVRVADSADFAADKTRSYTGIRRNFFTPAEPLPAGRYVWSYAIWDASTKQPASAWSTTRSFEIPERLKPCPLPSSEVRFANAARSHPRLWLGAVAAKAFATALQTNPDHCGFATFFERSVQRFIAMPIHPEVTPYDNGVRTAVRWRAIYIECQEVLYAIRHLAIAGRLQGKPELTARAKEWLLSVAAWDPKGTTSRSYNDEAAFRIANALAWGYDWLYDDLSVQERKTVRDALLVRTRDLAEHIIEHARIHIFPYDSHAVRFLSAAMIPCCIALLHDVESDETDGPRAWLDYTVEYLFSIYSPWGGRDGGWAEGPHYWTLGLAYLLDAAELMQGYLGVDLLARPFFQATARFPIYTKPPGARRVSFGDDSTMGDLPSLKVGSNVRRLARVLEQPLAGHAIWYDEELKRQDTGTARLFYNYGWWDFDFENLTLASAGALPAAREPSDLPSVVHFADVGWVAIQRHMHAPAHHVHFVLKASPYGSLSHSHGDQGAFLLRAFGEDLAIQSGHYVAFNSAMHREWRRQTRSKNAILIGGKGQYAGTDKGRAKAANGRIVEVQETARAIVVRCDTTHAYRAENASVERVERTVHYVDDSYFVIVDRVETSEPEPVQWLLHGATPFDAGGATFRMTGERAGLYGQMVYASAGKPKATAVTGFPGIPDAEIVKLAIHYHVAIEVPAARRTSLVTLLVPYPRSAPMRILHYTDDQGYEARVTFVDAADREYVVVVQKDL